MNNMLSAYRHFSEINQDIVFNLCFIYLHSFLQTQADHYTKKTFYENSKGKINFPIDDDFDLQREKELKYWLYRPMDKVPTYMMRTFFLDHIV